MLDLGANVLVVLAFVLAVYLVRILSAARKAFICLFFSYVPEVFLF